MTTETLANAAHDVASSATASADKGQRAFSDAADKGQKAFNDAMATAQEKIVETARVAQKALKEGAETLRAQSKVYRESAGEQLDEAQRYVVEKVKERPVTAALTGLGVGLLLGLLLANRDR